MTVLKIIKYWWLLPTFLLVLWVLPQKWWLEITLLSLGIQVIVHAIGRFSTFIFIQRQWFFVFFGVSYLLQGVALILSAFLAAPYPLEIWWVRPVNRIIWMISLPFFAQAVYLEALWGIPITWVRLRAWSKDWGAPVIKEQIRGKKQ